MISEQDIIDALRAFYEREGRTPTVVEWQRNGRPSVSTIVRVYGRWTTAREAADLPKPCRIGGRSRMKVDETAAILARLEQGASLGSLADELGITHSTLSTRVKRYCELFGLPEPPIRHGRRSAEQLEAEQLADESRRID